jgi:hypothetical protein
VNSAAPPSQQLMARLYNKVKKFIVMVPLLLGVANSDDRLWRNRVFF